jgi:nucleotide-binding universal stress UspA family protein
MDAPEEEPVHEIAVPLDRSVLAERAVGIARALGAVTGSSIRLIEVAAAEDCDDALDYLQTAAAVLLPGSDVAVEVVESSVGDRVGDVLIDRLGSTGPDVLLCMSTHGRSGVGSALLGSTAEEVLRHSTQPVLLVGRHCDLPWPGHRHGLVVPIDGTRIPDGLLRAVGDLVTQTSLEAILVKVTHPFDVEDAHHPLSGLDDAGERLTGLGVDAKLVHRFASNVPLALAEIAVDEGAAIILMASYVKAGMARTLIGSVAMRTVHEAPCPVLVYPGTILSD